MKWLIKAIAHVLIGPYQVYAIYDMDKSVAFGLSGGNEMFALLQNVNELAQCPDAGLRSLASYAGEGAYGFGAWVGNEISAVCWFWVGDRYATRNFWPLRDREAKLVQITTGEQFRGRGIAPRLIAFSTSEMHKLGYDRLFARIWHSNQPSKAAFTKAGWRHCATVLEVFPMGAKQPWRFVIRGF